jgi:ROK family protein (putative glucokinase)
MKQYVFGIDVGGTSIKCGLFKADGTVVEKWEITTRTDEQGSHILRDVADGILTALTEFNIRKEEVIGIGIGVPGPVKADGTVLVAVNLGWGFKDIIGELKEYTGLDVKAGNDANVAALGEMWQGGGQGFDDMIMVTLGTGVGCGVIVNGRIVIGAHGAAGEIGHARVDLQEQEQCNCGNRGCLEQQASATGIVKVAKEELASSTKESLLRDNEISAKIIFDAYKVQDELAITIVKRFGAVLGNALAICSTVVDPGVIVIGGGVSKAGSVLIDVLKEYFDRDAFPACREADIVLAQLGNDAGIYGAAKLIIDEQK